MIHCTWYAERRIPSHSIAAQEVLSELIAELEANGWSHREIFQMQLAFDEAVMNAITHGNGGDEKKFVSIAMEVSPTQASLEITDEGPGFDPDDVRDCTGAEAVCEPHGRGLLLIRTYMTSVEYHNRGSCVVLRKVRSLNSQAA